MLQEILESINNFFAPISAEEKTFTIANGMISPTFGAEDGDRFMICGSRRNDGVYTWRTGAIMDDDDKEEAGLRDETFTGTIRAMSVPPALLALSGEIKEWVDTYSEQLTAPIQSESFNGYSYALKSGGGTGGSGTLTWRDQFKSRLDRWRKPCL